mmetsp:Transcript_20208/g.51605  ORF Transcript_20208/g.51605 Transcript_20208/m.51605 type:complete len:636 (-) Transcript_20208:238-2145(-)
MRQKHTTMRILSVEKYRMKGLAHSFSISPCGNYVIMPMTNKTACIWRRTGADMREDKIILRHPHYVSACLFHPTPGHIKLCATACRDGKVRFYNLLPRAPDGDQADRRGERKEGDDMEESASDEEGSSESKEIIVQEILTLKGEKDSTPAMDLSFSPCGQYMTVTYGLQLSTVYVYCLDFAVGRSWITAKLIAKLSDVANPFCHNPISTAGRKALLVAAVRPYESKMVTVWQSSNTDELKKGKYEEWDPFFTGETNTNIHQLAFASSCPSFWQCIDAEEAGSKKGEGEGESAQPSGTLCQLDWLAAGCAGGEIVIWRCDKSKPVPSFAGKQVLSGKHTSKVTGLTFALNEDEEHITLASSDRGNTVCVWRSKLWDDSMSASRFTLVHTVKTYVEILYCCSFSPTGESFFVCGEKTHFDECSLCELPCLGLKASAAIEEGDGVLPEREMQSRINRMYATHLASTQNEAFRLKRKLSKVEAEKSEKEDALTELSESARAQRRQLTQKLRVEEQRRREIEGQLEEERKKAINADAKLNEAKLSLPALSEFKDSLALLHLERQAKQFLEQVKEAQEKVAEKERKILDDQKTCKVCLEELINIVLIPCGHQSLCSGCAQPLSDCPICRAPIAQRVKVFFS